MNPQDETLLRKVAEKNANGRGASPFGIYEVELHLLCDAGYLLRCTRDTVTDDAMVGYWLSDKARRELDERSNR